MIEFHRLARQELRQALSWYQGKSAQAAERFFLQVVRTMERISHDPASFPKIGRDKHYLRISQFPFMLVFQIRPDDSVGGIHDRLLVKNNKKSPSYDGHQITSTLSEPL